MRRPRWLRPTVLIWTANLALLACASLVALTVGDGALALAGVPKLPPFQWSNPPHFKEVRRNLEFEYEFETNGAGLRYRELAPVPAAGERRVFVVGDSYTEGWGIASGDRFSDLLEREFSSPAAPVAFINGGLAGASPLTYARLFRYVGLGFRPNGVLICLFANDPSDTRADQGAEDIEPEVLRSPLHRMAYGLWPRLYWMTKRVKARADSAWQRTPRDFVTAVSQEARRTGIPDSRIQQWQVAVGPKLIDAATHGMVNPILLSTGLLHPIEYSEGLELDTPHAERKWRALTSFLSAIVEDAHVNGVEVAIIYLPTRFQYDAWSQTEEDPEVAAGTRVRAQWLIKPAELENQLVKWTLDRQVPFLDLTPAFRAAIRTRGTLNWRIDSHWNSEGHRVAAEAIAAWLRQSKPFGFLP